jgi:hypothetical protein
MALGDGIRRNVAHVSAEERERMRDAIMQLDVTELYPGGPSKWDIQDEIHQATHVHDGPAFLTWHRELCNRFEAMLREADPDLSLHYWDWTTDPRDSSDGTGGSVNLFTPDFMGSSSGSIGAPLNSLGAITRNVNGGIPGAPGVPADTVILTWSDGAPQADQYNLFRRKLEGEHGSPSEPGVNVHGYIGGTIALPHSAFEDPFVFLLHSNVDRLFAMWQMVPGQAWRLDPAQVYGAESSTTGLKGIMTPMEPWAGIETSLRPWAPPENLQVVKNSRHPSVVRPPCYDTLPFSVDLITPDTPGAPITFNDIPEGATAARAAVFKVIGCRSMTFNVLNEPGAPFSIFSSLPVTTTPSDRLEAEARVWFAYTGTNAGDVANSNVTIRCEEIAQEWTIPINAYTVAWPTVASMLVLDKSGSMAWDSGITDKRRIDVLHDSAPIFVQIMPDNDAIGIASFDHDAYPVMPVSTAGPPIIGSGRATANNEIDDLEPNPAGATSIGDGVFLAHNTLTPVSGFDHKAIVVFTDGHENRSRYLDDPEVQSAINEQVFAIGLGTADKLNPNALNELADNSGGFLLMTGTIGNDDLLRLHKYFLQVLAGVTNTAIVVDPESSVRPGQEHRIRFDLHRSDITADVILLSPAPWAFEFLLETPAGEVIDRIGSASIPGISYVNADQVHYYRMSLPLPIADGEHEGTWYAVLRMEEDNFKEYLGSIRQREDRSLFQRTLAQGIPYSVNVQAQSNLHMKVSLIQSSREPGATVTLRALLSEYEQPMINQATVQVQIARPDDSLLTLQLPEVEAGAFENAFVAHISGIYRLTFHGEGKTWHGQPFTREAIRTAAVWRGGDEKPPTTATDPLFRNEQLCEMIKCAFKDSSILELLRRHDIDAENLLECFTRLCQVDPGEAERLRQPRLARLKPGVLGELNAVLGSRTNEFLEMIEKLLGESA